MVFDVAQNPQQPTFVGAIANGFDHSINDIVIDGAYAYLAIKPGSGATGSGTNELMILDIKGQTPIDTKKGYNANRASGDTAGATALYLLDKTLYMGRERSSNTSKHDFYVFDMASQTKPTVIKSQNLGIATGGGMKPAVTDVVVQGRLGFIATTDPIQSLRVYDMYSSLTSIVPVQQKCPSYVTLQRLLKIEYAMDRLYVLHGNGATVSIIHDNPTICPIP